MESKPWEYKECFSKGYMEDDYSGYYEVTNGNISLCTTYDPEDITETENTLQRVASVLNESGCKFYCNTTTEHALHIENMELRYKVDELKERCEKMEMILNKITVEPYSIGEPGATWGDSKYDSMSAAAGYNQAIDNITAKVNEALKEGESNTPAGGEGKEVKYEN